VALQMASVPPRVLVVDDEPAIRALVAKIVERAGLPVDTAADGAEAIEKMEAQLYSVVVLDLMMPRVDGFGVVEHVRHNMSVKPALIVATAGDISSVRQLDGTVVHSVVRKPFEIDVLGELIVAAAKLVAAEQSRAEDDSVLRFRRQS
jgi:CheY-like chemotaxis protein